MDVDSSMSSESDHDTPVTVVAAANHHLDSQAPVPQGGSVPPPQHQNQQGQGQHQAAATGIPVGDRVLPQRRDARVHWPKADPLWGATALEGNSATPPSSAGSAGIRLAGATADVHCYDVLGNRWTRLTPLGEPPSPRAAHVATAVGTMVVIQGGIGPAGLSAEDLHVLDLTQQRHDGTGSCSRTWAWATLWSCDGLSWSKRPLADVWALDTAAKPYEWRKLEPEGEGPPPCMYATASARSDGLLFLCGGGMQIVCLWQVHMDLLSIEMDVGNGLLLQVFVNARLHVSGGALGGGRMVEDSSSIAVLDTAAGVWCDTKSVVTSPRTGRYSADTAGGMLRLSLHADAGHAAAAVGDMIYIYGGLRGGVLLDDLLIAEDLAAAETTIAASHAAAVAAAANIQPNERERQAVSDSVPDGSVVLGTPVAPPVNGDLYSDISTENAMLQGPRYTAKSCLIKTLHAEAISAALAAAKARQINGEAEHLNDRDGGSEATPSGKQIPNLIKVSDTSMSNDTPPPGVRLHHRLAAETGGALGGMVRQLSIDQFENEGRRVIAHLLKPRGWKPPVRRQFFLDCNEIADLCDNAERIFSSEPTFGDLMRLFDEYGAPSTAGDIAYIDYLFLGDYVDRGQHSLETITLLLALKGERDGIWAWHRINRLFNWLPLAALIEKKIICMHGGIGRSINHIEQIENLQRPITMEAGSVVLMDLLWSDPTENDSVEGLRPNTRGPGLVTFGPDRVMEFCNNNDLQLIVRAHECVMDGFERFAQGHLITLFSATNYCGTANNAGAILVLGRDLVVVPKLIHPLPPAVTSPETSPERHIEDTWMQELNANRPPTPTRGVRK
ncbi:hypothetical protein HPP92_017123 [Vanilla planifolia]|uniref:Serine/threonine-protein phosphatase n=1 Tax=Vanilla planifolia TaxID=51239 RepID=A0A835Q7G1_VANPL|nr:hypothetical protein HPP92_017123 [Vanilla planifolia]